MAYLAVNKDGTECVFDVLPSRGRIYITCKYIYFWDAGCTNRVELPTGTIKKLIGRDMKWEDEPVELK